MSKTRTNEIKNLRKQKEKGEALFGPFKNAIVPINKVRTWRLVTINILKKISDESDELVQKFIYLDKKLRISQDLLEKSIITLNGIIDNFEYELNSNSKLQIFISHSQKDGKLKNFFSLIFNTTSIRPIFEEYEKFIVNDFTVEKIKKDISESRAVFVLLGEGAQNLSFTRDWIAFESGYAHAKGKDVWIFDSLKPSQRSFITPGVKHFVPLEILDANVKYIHDIIESYRKNGPRKIGKELICPKCNSQFYLHNIAKKDFRCPVCNVYVFTTKLRNDEHENL